jgi:pSer/pThr/pTyr-binding forkhead associated (FHA) protein
MNLSSGDRVPLDRDIVLGRAPSVTDSQPSLRPHVVQLAGAGDDISRTHLRITLEGWHVQAVDLGSTNGTIVTLPGQQPVRLRPHDPFTIVPGTLVSLADEVTLRYEVTA